MFACPLRTIKSRSRVWIPTALKVQALLPQPTNANLVNNYAIPGYTNFTHTEIPTLKLDHNVNSSYQAFRFLFRQSDLLAGGERLHAGIFRR